MKWDRTFTASWIVWSREAETIRPGRPGARSTLHS